MLQFLLLALPQILLLLYILTLREDNPYRTFSIPRPKALDLLHGLVIFAGVFLLMLALGTIVRLLPEQGRSLFSSGYRWQLSESRLLPLVLLFCLATGYREELFFRAYLLTRLRQLRLPPVAAVLAGSLLFAAGHAYQGPAGIVVALIQGVYFSILYLRLQNIHPIAVAHGLYNTAVLTLTLYFEGGRFAAPELILPYLPMK